MKAQSYKNIITLAVPTIISGIADPVIGATDLILVGDLGEESIATVGIGGSAVMSLVWIIASLLMSISARIAFHFGAKETKQLIQLVSFLLPRLLLVLIITTCISWLFSEQIISFYNPTSKEIKELAISYFKIRLVGFTFILFSSFSFQIFKGLHKTIFVLYITTFATLLNFILDFCLIKGLYGFMEMGVLGAAWASAISQVIMGIVCLIVLVKSKLIKFGIAKYHGANILITNSINLFFRTCLLNICIIYGNKITTSESSHSIATHTIMANMIINISYFMDGVANAATIILGKLNGQSDNKSIKIVAFKTLSLNTGFCLLTCLAYYFFDHKIIRFYTIDTTIYTTFKSVEFIFITCLFFGSIAFTFDGIYIGLENTKLLRNTLLTATILVYLPILHAYNEMNLHGVWVALCAWMIVRGLLPLTHFLYRNSIKC